VKKTWILRSGVVVVLLASLTALYARGREPDVEDNTPEFEIAEHRMLEVTAEAAGLIEPIRLVEVKSKASGEILRLTVESGDAVRRGDLLGQIDPRDVRNAFEQAQADLDVAKARLETSESAHRRSMELREANVITQQEFESAKLEEANARAQFIKARTNLELAQERLGDVTIRAPIDGVIIRKDVESGQIIQSASQNISGGTTIFVMADLTEMQVRTLVSETDLGKIQPGMSARVSVEAYPGRIFQGSVTKIEPQAVVEQNVTMFPVLVHLSNHDGALKPGMNAEVVVEVARRDNALTIPNAAVVSMRDAAAAGALFGLSEDRMRTALRGARGGDAQPGGDAGSAAPATPEAAGAAAQQAGAGPRVSAQGNRVATTDDDNGEARGAQAPQLSAECQALRERVTAAGMASASDEDRARLRECMQAAGVSGRGAGAAAAAGATPQVGAATARAAPAAQPGGSAGAAAGGMQAGGSVTAAQGSGARGMRGSGSSDVRPGIVFVHGANGIEPRSVMLGVNDWDHTEVLRGLEAGEHVVLISVARLQAQQQEMLNRMRQRNSGMFPGASAPAGRR
jgi:HlyD family secretion protein